MNETLRNYLRILCSPTTPNVQVEIQNILYTKDHNWVYSEHTVEQYLILSAISKHHPNCIDGAALASILMQLTKIESEEGGPYYTTPLNGKLSIDLDSNVLIGYFLSLQEVSLPSITNLIDTAITSLDFSSDTFGSDIYTIYFISKFYAGPNKEPLIDHLMAMQPVSFIDNVLILISLQYLGADAIEVQEAVSILLEHSNNDLDDPLADALFQELIQAQETLPAPKGISYNAEEQTMMDSIITLAEKRFELLTQEMMDLAIKNIQKTIKGNPDKQMSLMPYYVKKALGEKGKSISEDMIAKMGLANICYWAAFIIYDDFWDEDETSDPQILPSANLYARHYTDFFSRLLPSRTGFMTFFHSLMDVLDSANTWETIHCRTKVEGDTFAIPEVLPDYETYEKKYEPASGQILGPVAQFVYLGHDLESNETKQLIAYFKHYLIAMQINDDAHDWEEDMKRGTLSTVVVMLLEVWKETYPDKKTIDLIADKEALHHLFWFKTIEHAYTVALDHTRLSRKALHAISIFENIETLERYIERPEKVALQGLKKQTESMEFMKTFHTESTN